MLISQARILRSGGQHGGVLGESLPSGLGSAVFLLCLHMVGKDQLALWPEAWIPLECSTLMT